MLYKSYHNANIEVYRYYCGCCDIRHVLEACMVSGQMEITLSVPKDTTLWNRIKVAFLLLIGKEDYLCKDIILENKDAQELLFAMSMQIKH
jgi:hypothetical protein